VITESLDLGDRFSHDCVLNKEGEVIEKVRMQSTEPDLRKRFEGGSRDARRIRSVNPFPVAEPPCSQQIGHQALVANPRKIRAITASDSKNDRNDAEKLARFAAHDPRLLLPIAHRSPERQGP